MEKKDGTKFRNPNIYKKTITVLLIIIIMPMSAAFGIVAAYISDASYVDTANFMGNLKLTTYIYDKDGNFIESLHGVENREYINIKNIQKHTRNAFIAIEDERFLKHSGIDIRRIFGALYADLKSGRYDQGASTITQQLIKNTILTRKKEMKRKIQEAYLALKIESELSKDEILEYYLNTIYLGGNAYGLQAASQYYFSKDASELSLAESALIAGLTQSPSKYNPYLNGDSPEVYKNRQLTVLSKMLELEMITQEEYEKAKLEELNFKKRDSNSKIKYPWFMDAVIRSITTDLKAEYRYEEDEIIQLIYGGGLKIYTTLDPKVQDIVDKSVDDPKYYPQLKKDVAVWGKDAIIQPQAAVVINDYKTGQVRAVSGGRGEQPFRSQNRATDPTFARQPGSAMKPIAVYGPAFDLGYSTGSVIDDSPFNSYEASLAAGWPKEGPKNHDGRYRGLTTIREGVKWSSNVMAAKLILEIGNDASTEYIEKFGISTLVLSGSSNDLGPAKALGGLTKGVTPLEMSGAYGVFGNGGTYIEPILYTRVEDSDGNILLQKEQQKHEVISPQAAYMTIDVLKEVVNGGTGSAVKSKGNFTSSASAGKTGTTEKGADAYFAGLTPYYCGVIWMGHDKPSISINAKSTETAWMWGDIMRQIHTGLETKDFEMPEGLVTVKVCRDSGKLPTELCLKDPRGSRVIEELFTEDNVPYDTCKTHVSIKVDMFTGRPVNEFFYPFFTEEKIYIKRYQPVDDRVEDYEYQIPNELNDMGY
ncbi:penicillin-binding protein 1F [Oxobacter pfennigii]|uniref:Penicillin-binding protein 1A n=1 Tax=Oxobacter pfennigii TaxID=36849 RepID=A0A0P8W1K2_9CLOT|nr:PBP1A family penicillin-binding protein [Oxobacter pfennigii]KPU42297.1 penicillin-binding protein 1F [Oxobacter pfennigii]